MPRHLPVARTPDPMDAPALRWGVLGPGGIASRFAGALHGSTRQQLVAVGSRDQARAQAFADRFGAAAAYGSYQALVSDPEVDVVYVASPHSAHHEQALLAIEAGKHVLVEKAFTRNVTEASAVLDAAQARGVFAMEAMWSRFLPHYDVVRQMVADGLLGEVLTVLADHGRRLHPGGPERLASPDLAGGALLDLGVYPIHFASLVLGDPATVAATATLTERGVDAQSSIVVTSTTGAHGLLSASMEAKTPTTAAVCGSDARLEIPASFYHQQRVRLVSRGGEVLAESAGPSVAADQGLAFEAAEVARCISAGLSESPLLPHATTLAVMATMDEIRRQVGVVYPGE